MNDYEINPTLSRLSNKDKEEYLSSNISIQDLIASIETLEENLKIITEFEKSLLQSIASIETRLKELEKF